MPTYTTSRKRKILLKLLLLLCIARAYGYLQIEKMKKNYHLLPERHKELLKDYPSHTEKCKEAIDTNYEFIKGVVSNAIGFLNNSDVSDFVR